MVDNMGSFSWLRADKITKRKNIVEGDVFKILIPKEFGGGFIKTTYEGYGKFYYDGDKKADLHGILAYWNKCEEMIYEGDKYPSTIEEILKYGNTCLQENRCKGIKIGTYDKDVDKLKYPLKLVSASYMRTYEECGMKSYTDPHQGFKKTYWVYKDR